MVILRYNHSFGAQVDVWPAFTDFVSSSVFIFIFITFVFLSVFLGKIYIGEFQEENELEKIHLRQDKVKEALKKQLKLGESQFKSDGMEQRIILQDTTGSGGIRFEPGRAELSQDAKNTLNRIFEALAENKEGFDRINIEGHSDADPITTENFPSNWELSAARAGAVVNYFISKQNQFTRPWRLTAIGRGESIPFNVKNYTFTKEDTKACNYQTNGKIVPSYKYIVRGNKRNLQKANNRRIEIVLFYSTQSKK